MKGRERESIPRGEKEGKKLRYTKGRKLSTGAVMREQTK